MLGYKETYDIVKAFYIDCVKFWTQQGENVHEAHNMAKKDLEAITTNPFSPRGELLNPEAKADFLKWYKMYKVNKTHNAFSVNPPIYK